MKHKEIKPTDVFQKAVFWDAEFENLDFKEDKRFIISRVLTRGNEEEIWFILDYYPKEDILDVLNSTKGLDPKTVNFFNLVL
jgi:hypothetical protein